MSFFTSDQNLVQSALNVTWTLIFSTFPSGFKGMQRGVIRALGIQHLALIVNLIGHWIINLSLQYLLGFYFGLGMLGMWLSKMILELFLFGSYSLLLHFYDWNKAIEKSKARQEGFKKQETKKSDAFEKA